MGKWTLDENPDIAGVGDASIDIYNIEDSDKVIAYLEAPADVARLMIAAPEMAEFLEALIADDVQADENVWPWQQDARALLARIEGESD